MQDQPTPVRRYSAPNLTTYGDVIKYTASGTNSPKENAGDGGKGKKP